VAKLDIVSCRANVVLATTHQIVEIMLGRNPTKLDIMLGPIQLPTYYVFIFIHGTYIQIGTSSSGPDSTTELINLRSVIRRTHGTYISSVAHGTIAGVARHLSPWQHYFRPES
jgi:hypothetical protein